MRLLVNGNPRVSDGFDVLRPIDNPVRPHGAVDFVVPYQTPIYAPEEGMLQYHLRIRSEKGSFNNDVFWPVSGKVYAFRNYFYDWAGGLVIVYGKSGLTHVVLHTDGEEIMRRLVDIHTTKLWHHKSVGEENFYLISNLSRLVRVREGDCIAVSGRAGDVRGDHIHYEIHKGLNWTPHRDRPNPEEIFNL